MGSGGCLKPYKPSLLIVSLDRYLTTRESATSDWSEWAAAGASSHTNPLYLIVPLARYLTTRESATSDWSGWAEVGASSHINPLYQLFLLLDISLRGNLLQAAGANGQRRAPQAI
jgi:hypothetical protein